MYHLVPLAVLASASVGLAQRPANMSICDYYTTALFKDNTAENQLKLVTAVVNRAGIGNMTTTPPVTGIANPGMYNNVSVDISVYFTGAQNSTNRGGDQGVSVNFLDGGGATAFEMGKAGNDTNSNQFKLFSHLYEYFGALLMCSNYGKDGYPAYEGKQSQYEVHKFMDLDENEVGYFNTQVGLSAASFGVTEDDVKAVGTALNSVFNVRCAPKQVVIPSQPADYQSICIAETCALSPNATCDSYPKDLPKPVNVTMTNGTSSSNSSSPSSGSPSPSASNGTPGSSAASPNVAAGSLTLAMMCLLGGAVFALTA